MPLDLPDVGGDHNTWGSTLNAALTALETADAAEAAVRAAGDAAAAAAYPPKAAPATISGQWTFTTPPLGVGAVAAAAAPVFNVKDYGAVGNDAAADGPAIQAAVAAAAAASFGGIVYFPPGIYRHDLTVNGPIVLPQRVNNPVHLVGAGDHTSRIKFLGDTGANTFAIRASAKSGGNYSRIEHLRLQGPGTTTTFGAVPAQVRGIELSAGMRLHRVSATGFYAGARVIGDHIGLLDCRLGGGNYAGLEFADMQTQGDLVVINCDLGGATFASVLMKTGSFLTGATFVQGHLGYAPYCIYAETGATLIGSVVFQATSWEIVGHGCIVSADRLLKLEGVTFQNCGPFGKDATYGKIGARTDFITFDVGTSKNVRAIGCTFTSLADPAAPTFKFAGLSDSLFDSIPTGLVTAARTAGLRLFDVAGSVPNVRVRFEDGLEGVLLKSASGGSHPARGQLVIRRPGHFVDVAGANPGPTFGVAAETAGGNSKSTIIATAGRAPVQSSNAAPQFTRLVRDTTVLGSAKSEALTVSPPSAQSIGTVGGNATGAAGLVDVDLFIDPGY